MNITLDVLIVGGCFNFESVSTLCNPRVSRFTELAQSFSNFVHNFSQIFQNISSL